MENQNRILGRIVGEVLTNEELELISGGLCPIVCNGCHTSTSTGSGDMAGCKCD